MNLKIGKLRNWLRGHVLSPSTPKTVTLLNIELDPREFKGSFNLILDSFQPIHKFSFYVDQAGRYEISSPLYISPMGVPSSYPSIELTDETTESITKIINDFLPKMKPFGLDKKSGVFLDRNAPSGDRIIDINEVNAVLHKLSDNQFKLTGAL